MWQERCNQLEEKVQILERELSSRSRLQATCEELLETFKGVQGIPAGLVDAKELMRYLPKSEKTIRQWVEKGIIPAIRVKAGDKGENVTLLFDPKQVISSLKGL